jgi:hypothetical protein
MHIRITNPFLGGLVLVAFGTLSLLVHPRRSAPVSIAFGYLLHGLGALYWVLGAWAWWHRRRVRAG